MKDPISLIPQDFISRGIIPIEAAKALTTNQCVNINILENLIRTNIMGLEDVKNLTPDQRFNISILETYIKKNDITAWNNITTLEPQESFKVSLNSTNVKTFFSVKNNGNNESEKFEFTV